MADQMQRVIRDSKNSKHEKLGVFLKGGIFPTLDAGEQDRLTRQHQVMGEYVSILQERIAKF